MKQITLISCFFIITAFASDEITIKSKEAFLQESGTRLVGSVHITHPIGSFSCEKAQTKQQNKTLKQATLEKNVNINLHDEQTLSCEEANIDFEKLLIHINGSGFPIHYQNVDKKNLLAISCMSADGKLMRLPFANKYDMQHMNLYGNVHLLLNDNCHIYGDKGSYQSIYDPSCNNKHIGIISLYPKQNETCRVTQEGSTITAGKMTLNTKYDTIEMENAQGSIKDATRDLSFQFSTELLNLERSDLRLIFHGNSVIESPAFGTIACNNQIEMKQQKILRNSFIETIRSVGQTHFSYFGNEETETFTCYGTCELSPILQTFKAHVASDNKQHCYHHSKASIYCDEVELDYEHRNGLLKPNIISFKGHVKLLLMEQLTPFTEAICDQIEYYPETDTLLLTSFKANQVILYDKNHQEKMIASTLKITNKKDVEAIGKVSFYFDSKEQEIFKHFFKRPPH